MDASGRWYLPHLSQVLRDRDGKLGQAWRAILAHVPAWARAVRRALCSHTRTGKREKPGGAGGYSARPVPRRRLRKYLFHLAHHVPAWLVGYHVLQSLALLALVAAVMEDQVLCMAIRVVPTGRSQRCDSFALRSCRREILPPGFQVWRG